eukprot:TRINITY_DN30306_c0_g1_i1.p1 TRINITY_DN30306_c0_g1~~TRINITY_DN30306_c0_g1_i1.p1  ORF type:complete len:352 (+),score=44.15 TRINITY_DN30306_c0_g1_i1:145-1200(+)
MPQHAGYQATGCKSTVAETLPDFPMDQGELPAVPRSARLNSRRPAPVTNMLPPAAACEDPRPPASTEACSTLPELGPFLPAVSPKISHSQGTRSPLSSRSPATSRDCSPWSDRDERSTSKSSSRSPRGSWTLTEEIKTIKHRRGREPLIPLNPLRSFRRIEQTQCRLPRRVVSEESASSPHQSPRTSSTGSTTSKLSFQKCSSAADAPALSLQDSSKFDKELKEQIDILASSAAEEAARSLGDWAKRHQLAMSLHGSTGQTLAMQHAGDDYRQQILDSIDANAEEDVETLPDKSPAPSRATSQKASVASVILCASKVEQKIARLRLRTIAAAQDQAPEILADMMPPGHDIK